MATAVALPTIDSAFDQDTDGTSFGAHGVHREIVTPERVVTTESMDGFDGEAINTLELVEAGGRTTYQALVTSRPVYARAQAASTS